MGGQKGDNEEVVEEVHVVDYLVQKQLKDYGTRKGKEKGGIDRRIVGDMRTVEQIRS